MITIRYVQEEDKNFWFGLDKHISEKEFEKKIRDRMGYVLSENNTLVALLRYNLFWDSIPFCNMLFVDWEYQRKGYGKKIMEFWENDMRSMGYEMVMTSTQSDENAQHFYRKLGYKDSGGLLINIPQFEQPMELFFVKKI